jgi:Icc-related predicted phosphoesterase
MYGIDVFVMPGNDDPWACDPVIESATHVQPCADRVVQVGPHEMISCAYSNPTPWNSPRELDENALFDRIDRLAQQLEDPSTAIFNLHAPPYDTGLDTAIEVNPADLTHVYNAGSPNEIPVGSRAVREVIEKYQPLLSLHGHIHESRGEAIVGRTLALNSGSEYNSGRIHGVIVKLDDGNVARHQFVVG